MGRLDRQFHDGVADSLQRLKRAAEERARQADGKLDNRAS
jgi:hypothetical protein